MKQVNRRNFIKKSGMAAGAILVGPQINSETKNTLSVTNNLLPKPSEEKMIGIQIPAVSFIDEGVKQVLDTVQQRAGVNTLFLTVLAFNDGLAGRQLKGFALPDHGKQGYDNNFHGGYYATLHPHFHKTNLYKHFRAPDHGSFDVLAEVIPEAKKRKLKTVVFLADNLRPTIPGAETLTEINLYGKHTHEVCINNALYRETLMGIIEDCVTSYDIDGILYRSERIGPLSKTLGLNHFGTAEQPPVCFCSYCTDKAKLAGIQMEKVRKGYEVLTAFVNNCKQGKRPSDGYHVTFWRILLQHPDILVWQTFQSRSLQELYKIIYKKVKQIKPEVSVGWAIALNNNINPIYRAEQDWQAFAPYSDFLKVVMYHNAGGPRMVAYINNLGTAMMGDLTKEQLLEWEYAIMNYKERGYDQIAYTGFSSDYVFREAKRAVDGVQGTATKIYAGIDVDLPTAENHTKSTPQSIKNAVSAAFKGGVSGVVLARKYSEMRLSSLSGAGEAVKELNGQGKQ